MKSYNRLPQRKLPQILHKQNNRKCPGFRAKFRVWGFADRRTMEQMSPQMAGVLAGELPPRTTPVFSRIQWGFRSRQGFALSGSDAKIRTCSTPTTGVKGFAPSGE